MGPKQWVYKGYGIFQYDLQFVREHGGRDEGYFRFRQWYDFAVCLDRVMGELNGIYARNGGDLWEAVRAYNGSGPHARAYRDNVRQFTPEAQREIDAMGAPHAGAVEARRGGKPIKTTRKAKKAKAAKPQPGDVLLATAVDRPAPARATRARSSARRGGEMPGAKPQMSREDVLAKISVHGIDRAKHPLLVIGIRGYYRDTMGAPGVNDRGMYDDALFIDSPDVFAAYNGNTDPSKYRPGEGTADATKGIASLLAGAWFVHRFDKHNGQYLALCQRAGKVTVIRDGKKEDYKDTGNFGINIHRGSYHGTSSLGCQTLHPDQWDSFIALAVDQARRHHGAEWKSRVVPYVLVENA
jgi:lysozyme